MGIEPYIREPNKQNSYWYMDSLVTFLATSEETAGRFGMVEFRIVPGNEPPLHVHEREDEFFYVLEGDIDYVLGGMARRATAGSWVFLPRGVPHTFRLQSDAARMLVMVTPGGFEGYFKDLSRPATELSLPPRRHYGAEDIERCVRLAGEYGLTFLPEAAAAAA